MNYKSIVVTCAIALMAFRAGAQSGKTAGEAMKNVQVLKDLSVSDWAATMGFMSGALGVSCAHCHQGLDYEKDDLKAKQTARAMIRMTREINAKNFDGRLVVTCNTCHQGSIHPKAMPAMWSKPEPSRTAGAADSVSSKVEKVESLPDADQVLANYRKAVGGDGLKSLRMKATMIPAARPPFEVDMEFSFPDKFLQHVSAGGQEFENIINGDRGWIKTPARTIEMTADKIPGARRGIDAFRPMKLSPPEAPRKTVGVEKIAGRTYTVVESVSARQLERLYFDTQTGLLYKWYLELRSPLGSSPSEAMFEDYRDVNGVKLPYIITSTSSSDRTQVKFSEIETNVAVDPARFEPPQGAGK